MALILQIVVLLVVLVGLITIIMSIKNWHWAQMLLLLGIFFMSLATLYLGLETFRLNRNIRKNINAKETQLAELKADVNALRRGAISSDPAVMRVFNSPTFNGETPYDPEAEGRMPSLSVWTTRLQDLARARGKVWRNALPTAVQQTGAVAVTIAPAQLAPAVDPDVAAASGEAPAAAAAAAPAAPQGHGLPVGAIVYAFENGAPNPAAPDQGAQYIGEFKVAQATETAVVLEPVQAITTFIGNRILKSIQTKATWSLYELMPADNHALFAVLDEATLKSLLPASTVNEYLRQGTPATPDDDQYHRAAFDEAGNEIGPDDAKADPSKVVKTLYNRPLRDYSYLFPEMMRERSVMEADIAELQAQIADLKAARTSAQQLEKLREQEKVEVSADLKNMERDLAFIKNLLAKINSQIANGRAQVDNLLKQNAAGAQTLIEEQLAELQQIDERSPAPVRNSIISSP